MILSQAVGKEGGGESQETKMPKEQKRDQYNQNGGILHEERLGKGQEEGEVWQPGAPRPLVLGSRTNDGLEFRGRVLTSPV